MSSTPNSCTSKPRFIDLFAGIGGMRMGFEQAGWECVYSVEADRAAFLTYQSNFPCTTPSKPLDIRQLKPQDLPACDAIVAGWPCQPFSRAGHQLGFLDPGRGDMFFELYRILDYIKPPAFLLENVPNLASHQKGRTLGRIIQLLSNAGYNVSYQILDSSAVCPQRRQRIYLVGLQKGRFTWPLPPRRQTHVLGDILHKAGEISSHTPDGVVPRKYILGSGTWQALQRHAHRHAGKGNGFGFTLASTQHKTRTLSARYYKDGAEILVSAKPRPRKLTPRECARLMGFPDTFHLVGSDTQAYRQLGNSVVVPMIKLLAVKLRKSLTRKNKKI